jgi:acetone carboxylase gamma subunit
MLSMPKDAERFEMYLDVLQDKVSFDAKIILPLGPHLYVVQRKDKKWVNMCACGHDFGDHTENWKLNAVVFVRDTEEAMAEVYPSLMAPDPKWQVYREFYCPTCGVMHDVEAPTPWYPVMHDFEPDIETFYKDWVHLPVPEKA